MYDTDFSQDHAITLQPIAYMRSDFPAKFGIPRQSGLIPSLHSLIVFEPAFRTPDALRGIEEFSHLWLIWGFSQSMRTSWSPTVRPPRLGGNERKGVFATRSPFRPNPLALSCVELKCVEWDTPNGAVLHVLGADLMDGTPIYDIKPYLPFADSHCEASGGFAAARFPEALNVQFPEHLQDKVSPQHRQIIIDLLKQDPRPAYHNDPDRIYGFTYANMEIRFTVEKDTASILSIEPL